MVCYLTRNKCGFIHIAVVNVHNKKEEWQLHLLYGYGGITKEYIPVVNRYQQYMNFQKQRT